MLPNSAPIVFSLAVALPLLAIACGSPGSDMNGAWSGTMDTLSSGEVEVQNSDDPLWEQEWRVEGEDECSLPDFIPLALFTKGVFLDVSSRPLLIGAV